RGRAPESCAVGTNGSASRGTADQRCCGPDRLAPLFLDRRNAGDDRSAQRAPVVRKYARLAGRILLHQLDGTDAIHEAYLAAGFRPDEHGGVARAPRAFPRSSLGGICIGPPETGKETQRNGQRLVGGGLSGPAAAVRLSASEDGFWTSYGCVD